MSTGTISNEIWEAHGDKLKAFISSKVDSNDCEDILHNVFLKIQDKEERIKWIEQPASYVIKMAQNAIIDFYRSQKKRAQSLHGISIITEEQLSDIKLADCCLLFFIQKLPPLYSEALILADLKNMSQKALAEKLNISYTAAKSRVQRARKMLKHSILDCCPYQFDRYGNIIDCCK